MFSPENSRTGTGTRVEGTWRELTSVANKRAANLTSQVCSIAKVKKVAALGNLPSKLRLRALTTKVTRATLEAESQGKLRGQARTPDAEGVRFELARNFKLAHTLASSPPASLPPPAIQIFAYFETTPARAPVTIKPLSCCTPFSSSPPPSLPSSFMSSFFATYLTAISFIPRFREPSANSSPRRFNRMRSSLTDQATSKSKVKCRAESPVPSPPPVKVRLPRRHPSSPAVERPCLPRIRPGTPLQPSASALTSDIRPLPLFLPGSQAATKSKGKRRAESPAPSPPPTKHCLPRKPPSPAVDRPCLPRIRPGTPLHPSAVASTSEVLPLPPYLPGSPPRGDDLPLRDLDPFCGGDPWASEIPLLAAVGGGLARVEAPEKGCWDKPIIEPNLDRLLIVQPPSLLPPPRIRDLLKDGETRLDADSDERIWGPAKEDDAKSKSDVGSRDLEKVHLENSIGMLRNALAAAQRQAVDEYRRCFELLRDRFRLQSRLGLARTELEAGLRNLPEEDSLARIHLQGAAKNLGDAMVLDVETASWRFSAENQRMFEGDFAIPDDDQIMRYLFDDKGRSPGLVMESWEEREYREELHPANRRSGGERRWKEGEAVPSRF
ncbi:hypothetical protein DXG01_003426 [Tephrocybe rancida]|nr:hypothetical protein DXG01_003426 [Tephrocybe rancida]